MRSGRGPVPIPDRSPDVAARVGVEQNPLDRADPDDRAWLRALIWPGPKFVPSAATPGCGTGGRRGRRGPPCSTGDIIDRLPAALDLLPPDCTPGGLPHRRARRTCRGRAGRSSWPWCSPWTSAGSPRNRQGIVARHPPGRDLAGPDSFVLSIDGRPVARHGAARRTDRLAVTAGDPGAGPRSGARRRRRPVPGPWPDDPRLDPELLARRRPRNVVDRYRYWTLEAIVADLDTRRHPFHVAIENLAHDLNIGTVVRTANAFLAAEVHIVGRRRWNRRGAMVTDRYQHLATTPTSPRCWRSPRARACPWSASTTCPAPCRWRPPSCRERCVLLFGQEGPGLTARGPRRGRATVSIAQFGSTRSINAGVAAAIAMHAWIRQHADLSGAAG